VHKQVLRRTTLINTTTRRGSTERIVEILSLCRNPTAKTRIMYKTNNSYSSMQKFMKQLQKLELLRLDDDAARYVTTEKGREFIGRYAALQDLLK